MVFVRIVAMRLKAYGIKESLQKRESAEYFLYRITFSKIFLSTWL